MGSSAVVVIQARLNSERFPDKMLADLKGKPVLAHVLERCRQIAGVDDVVVAVPNEAVRQRLHHYGIASVAVPTVSENDVLGRFAWLAQQWQSHDIWCRATGDCPRLDPRSAEKVLQRFREGNLDYVANMDDGGEADFEVFSRDALLLADKEASIPSDREHVTPWMKQHLRVDVILPPKGSKPVKHSIDTPEDLEAARRLVSR